MNILHINLFDDSAYYPQSKIVPSSTDTNFDKLVDTVNNIQHTVNVVLETMQTKTLNTVTNEPQLYQPTVNNGITVDKNTIYQPTQSLEPIQAYNVNSTSSGTQVFTSNGITFIGLIKTNYINPFKNGNWSDICGDSVKLNEYKSIIDSDDPLFNQNYLLESHSESNSNEYQQGKEILEFVRDSMLAAYTHLNLKNIIQKRYFRLLQQRILLLKT